MQLMLLGLGHNERTNNVCKGWSNKFGSIFVHIKKFSQSVQGQKTTRLKRPQPQRLDQNVLHFNKTHLCSILKTLARSKSLKVLKLNMRQTLWGYRCM